MSKKGKSKSMNMRTPFADVSNGRISREKFKGEDDHENLDRLLLVRSELSTLVNQIDQIFAGALEHNMKSKTANMDIESFIKLLSGMNSSLKPWISRLSQAQTISTPVVQFPKSLVRVHDSIQRDRNISPKSRDEHNKLGMIISPSPLVAWRAGDCGLATERQLFLLTPLSKAHVCSKIKARNLDIKDNNDAIQPCSSVNISKNQSNLPGILENLDCPNPSIVEENNNMVKSRVFNPMFLSSSPQDFKLKKDLFIAPLGSHVKNKRRDADEEKALEWFLSPPKTCILMNPENSSKKLSVTEDKSFILECLQERNKPSDGVYNENYKLHDLHLCNFTNNEDSDEKLEWFLSPPKTCTLMEPLEGKKIPSTPSVLGESVFRSRRPGENTLKKELWTRFQAVSIGRVSLKDSVFEKVAKKGFMDMLEEASF